MREYITRLWTKFDAWCERYFAAHKPHQGGGK